MADHALREALEPSMRLITPAVAWQIAAGVVAAYDGPVDAIEWTPRSVTAAVLHLAGELAEHLRGPADVRAVGEWLDRHAAAAPAGRNGTPAAIRKVLGCQRTREQLLPMVERYAGAKRAREVLDYGDQVMLAARIAQRHPEVGAGERGRYQAVLLDEYQDTSACPAGAAARAVRRRPPGDRGRRPVPVHLRLARRERGQPAPVRRRLPAARSPGRCPPASATPAGSWTRPG